MIFALFNLAYFVQEDATYELEFVTLSEREGGGESGMEREVKVTEVVPLPSLQCAVCCDCGKPMEGG